MCEGHVQACLGREVSLSFFLTQFLHISLSRLFTDRNFDRTSVRSRSFRRLNRAFSVLRRTKSGTAVANDTSEERDNLRNANIPPEGKCMCLTSTVFGHLSAGQTRSPAGWPAKHQLDLARRPARPEEDQLGDQLDQIKPVKINKPSGEQADRRESNRERVCV